MRHLGYLVLALALCPASASAQGATTGVLVQTYTMSAPEAIRVESLQLMTIPVGAHIPLLSWADLTLAGGFARASLSLPNGPTSEVEGLVDSRVRIAVGAGPFSLALTALVPTGDVVETLEQATLVGLLSSDLLPVATTQWGSGGGFAADLGLRRRIGSTGFGFSVGYLTLRESDALGVGTIAYRPGSQVRARVTAESHVGRASVLSLMLGVQSYASDTFDDIDFFRSGFRIEGVASLALPIGARESLLAYGGLYNSGAGSTRVPAAFSGVDDGALFPGTRDPLTKQVALAGVEARVTRDGWAAIPSGEIRLLRTAEGLGQGWVSSIGGRVEYRVAGARRGAQIVIEPSAAFRLGQLIAHRDAESGVRGWETGVAVRWEGR